MASPLTRALPLASDSTVADLVTLTKPRVVVLVTLVAAAGYYLGSPGAIEPMRLVLTLLGTALSAAGALALNMLVERHLDARMRRTAERPLPAGRLEPTTALAVGSALAGLGLGLLTLAVDPVAGLVTGLTVLSYLFAYTPLKQRTSFATVVGAVPGALPPVTGWVAARGELGPGAFVLFGILFFWQIPHSLAIARLFRDDYAAAGFRLLPVVDRTGKSTGRHVLLNTLALLSIGPLPALIGMAGVTYFVVALALGLGLLALALGLVRSDSEQAARRLYLGSLIYLPLLLLALTLDSA